MGQNERKGTNLYLSNLKKIPLEQFNQIHLSLSSGLVSSLEKILAKLEKKLLVSF